MFGCARLPQLWMSRVVMYRHASTAWMPRSPGLLIHEYIFIIFPFYLLLLSKRPQNNLRAQKTITCFLSLYLILCLSVLQTHKKKLTPMCLQINDRNTFSQLLHKLAGKPVVTTFSQLLRKLIRRSYVILTSLQSPLCRQDLQISHFAYTVFSGSFLQRLTKRRTTPSLVVALWLSGCLAVCFGRVRGY